MAVFCGVGCLDLDGLQFNTVDLTVAVQHVVRVADFLTTTCASPFVRPSCIVAVRIDRFALNRDREIQISDGVALGEAAVGAVFLCLEDVQQGG